MHRDTHHTDTRQGGKVTVSKLWREREGRRDGGREGGKERGREGERADLTNHIAEGRPLCRSNAAGHYLKFQWNFTDIGGW